MGNFIRTHKMMVWVIQMLQGTSFLRFLLQEYNHDLDSGIILIAENNRRAWQLEKSLIDNLDAVSVSKLKQDSYTPLNYQMGLHVYNKSDTEESIIDFLHQKNFLPVIIVGGIIPDNLYEIAYIMRLDISCNQITNISSSYKGFKEYVLNNLENVLKQLRNLKFESLMEEYDIDIEYEYFMHTSIAVGKIWKSYIYERFNNNKDIKENELEPLVASLFQDFMDCVIHAIEIMDNYNNSYDNIQESVRNCIIDYIEKHKDTFIEDINKTTSETDLNKTILFDDNFYYIQNSLFVNICRPLTETLSILQLKKYMQEANMLQCNNTSKGKYTPKVSLPFSKDGTNSSRRRFITIRKESVITDEGIFLEDYIEIYDNDNQNE